MVTQLLRIFHSLFVGFPHALVPALDLAISALAIALLFSALGA
jgi:hypothetical protein